MPTSLVTGGAGFLGSHLCDHLLGRGNRVICVDNLETGSLSNIHHIRGEEFRFLNLDITSHFEVDEPVDFIYHMASPASPIDYARLPLHTLKVGAYGTHNSLGLAKRKRGSLPHRLHLRGLRQSADPSPARELLGQRQPDRPARGLRRGQALRRGAVFEGGKDIKQVSEWLGHADPAFTLRTYVHLLDGGLGGADFLDEVVGARLQPDSTVPDLTTPAASSA